MAESHLPPAHYEKADISVRALAAGFAAVLLTLLCSMLLAMWMYPTAVVDRRIGSPLPRYPAPRLQEDPARDLQQFSAAEVQRLNSAGWVEKTQGVAHIPIDQAMRIIARDSIPDWPTRKDTTQP